MKVLTYISYKEHFKLYTEIYDSIAVNNCQIGLARKDIILLSDIAVILYKAGLRTDVEDRHIKLTLSAGAHSIDDFIAIVKVVVLPERQDWEPPQVKDLKLVIPEHYKFMASNTFFIALGILDNYLEKSTYTKSKLHPGSYKTSLDISPPPKSLSSYC